MRSSVLLVTSLTACARERDPAPTEMVDLVVYLFTNWEEGELLPEAVDNLGEWLDDNVDGEGMSEGMRLDPLTPADIATVEHPDTSLAELIGAVGAARSAYPIDDHTAYLVLRDQVFQNPSLYDRYDRTITQGDEGAWPTGAAEVLRTRNDIETTTLGVTIPYTLPKDYRWVEGATHDAVIGRAWAEERYCNDGGGNCLEHHYSVDMYFADGASRSQRMTASWSHVDASFALPEDTLVASLAMGIQSNFDACEEYLAGE